MQWVVRGKPRVDYPVDHNMISCSAADANKVTQITYIQPIPEDRATGSVKQQYDAAHARAGRVANIIRLMTQDAPTLSGSMRFYMSLMKSGNGLHSATREMLATVVSNVNGCFY